MYQIHHPPADDLRLDIGELEYASKRFGATGVADIVDRIERALDVGADSLHIDETIVLPYDNQTIPYRVILEKI